ncbi:MAG: hypothetical protein AUH85_03480 [Chloroflexi bacterium 13_1_40CM_4_68_4]|nr:MAG: hypothetical protein AUH85_03480 [Chloroflexi bacterium 13_1_40CM_4_68_4]
MESLYPSIVLLHVLSAFALVLTHGASAAVASRLRSERQPERIRALVDLSQASTMPFYPAFVLRLLTGVAAGVMDD